METDIGNPIEYDPTIDSLNNDKIDDNRGNQEDDRSMDQYYYQSQPQQMMYQNHMSQPEKNDLFSSVDKSTWIIAFAVFLLGFFMGKTMQPVILRYT